MLRGCKELEEEPALRQPLVVGRGQQQEEERHREGVEALNERSSKEYRRSAKRL